MTTATSRRNPFAWLNDFPTTAALSLVVLVCILQTSVRYLWVADPPSEMGGWLAFLGSLAGIVGGTVVGKRFTTDPAVITAEAASRQTPPPDVTVNSAGGINVQPQLGAVQDAPPVGGG